jgi:hypothetical protein
VYFVVFVRSQTRRFTLVAYCMEKTQQHVIRSLDDRRQAFESISCQNVTLSTIRVSGTYGCPAAYAALQTTLMVQVSTCCGPLLSSAKSHQMRRYLSCSESHLRDVPRSSAYWPGGVYTWPTPTLQMVDEMFQYPEAYSRARRGRW